ncbi:hypothetical protein [Cytophaga aurantiaca]|uniref:hypothetical protein n=1 Tax=Cytophaga aurantiaca TaxID=29530 RepID=UPI0003828745|nr:hypothetical protein [Cytophaga aurantiaca]
MKKLFFTAAVFLLVSLFSAAQKIVLNSIQVKEVRAFNGDRDTTRSIYTIDHQGYKQGPFQYFYKNQILVKGNYKNDILVDSCFFYNREGALFAKGNFTYKNDYNRTIGFSMTSYSKNYFAYLNDTLIVYNHPSDRSKPSVLVYKNNLKEGVFKINSKYGFENLFTYKHDTLHGPFRNVFILNFNKYHEEIFFEEGSYWNGANSYDDWYYKYLIKENQSPVLIQKTLYNKNIKLESATYYKTSGKNECLYYYSTTGTIDSIRCLHEEGNLKSFIHYGSNGEGVQYTYNKEGQLIKKASYERGLLNGYMYEYTDNVVDQKTLYKNDTIILKEQIQNNIVSERAFYKNNEVDKIDWFNDKGKYMHSISGGANGTISTVGSDETTPIFIYQKGDKSVSEENYAEMRADIVLYKAFPFGHEFYSKNNSNYYNAFVISKRENNVFRPNEYYNYTLKPIEDSLIAYSKTVEGKTLSKLKAPVTIIISLSLLKSNKVSKASSPVQLNKIVGGNKKINKVIEKFFVERTIQYSTSLFENQYIECSYTIYPN